MGYSAADIERYTYCPLSWYLAKSGHHGDDAVLSEGVRKHAEKGKDVARWRRIIAEHGEAFQTALYLALVAASAATLAIEVVFLEGFYANILMMLSLVWLLVSLGFLVHALRKQDEAEKFGRTAGFVAGELTYSDLDQPAATLRSGRYEVGGRPDYIVRDGPHYIPVEVKTGATPQKPHESHVLQCATYCLLVEETYGERPPHGIISYSTGHFTVPYTEEIRDKVLETILRMKLADLTGTAHRNHNRPGKCASCSRREACPERLA
ncbi:MAG TPA: CRISPR-associated protein Cas4 [Candidatus Thermoplasmatota archaeon]|nr:CRISPR-associated protein Cas4 [Candidatus Thermoplasmatota archaeon]